MDLLFIAAEAPQAAQCLPAPIAILTAAKMAKMMEGKTLLIVEPKEVMQYKKAIDTIPPPSGSADALLIIVFDKRVLVSLLFEGKMCEQHEIPLQLHEAAMRKARGLEV